MSFSGEVKEEIKDIFEEDTEAAGAERAAIVLFLSGRSAAEGDVTRIRELPAAKKYFTYPEKAAKIRSVRTPAEALAIAQACRGPEVCRAFLRGAFLASGSVSDPASHYHLEVVCADDAEAAVTADRMREAGFSPRIVSRKKNRVVYLKEGDQIADFLTLIGAHRALLQLESVRVLKEVRNTVNRAVNCDAANIAKSVEAARKQREDILFIDEVWGLDRLPAPLRDAALARLSAPEATLTEIGESLDPPVGKSGVSHRMGKIAALAQSLRTEAARTGEKAVQEEQSS